ncbi:bifunctional DNA-formamidopyrimidine glycosylase/DNA-(apurinic or apyrimidinic site) lyase [Nanchangia anserum]|uniref:Formamidopyrimidine-DNA glycosylase n=2 Tax=Nanchangia anserum TaxID=2692125 RepID=A0A8I0KWP7_9ACTO|nr:bifunctional DNA-formamidopyrimidine glycosylase/DNA-(apurinic or apyrimidinic site) lyase [Nanchangia anserum]MBD3690204.1 bifunctional DNA-formamidopyrimidine glycosylase/DNA-(apurinic or apyrimidinic site) lyase [Nanchangia anserum]QOX82584.1 bifunctional DNA-formamidopyrimidine glycosylase/DNA-(apurinic or apyrimidinic site) lyase [Nanchangia anserum]
MPELPEVEVVRRGLVDHARGHVITRVEVHDERIFRRSRHVAAPLSQACGRRIDEVARRGKYLWLVLDDGLAVVIHLGMSGQILANDARVRMSLPRHTRLSLHLDEYTRLDFVDQRIFGSCWISELVPTTDGHPGGTGTDLPALPRPLAHIARDPLDPSLAVEDVTRTMRASRRCIKAVLLDQSVLSGIGNIYADETLHAARVHPLRRANAATLAQLRDIVASSRDVMMAALAAGGTSFDSLYVDVAGHPGYFQRELAVYGRTGQPCRTCETPIERMEVAGRGTHVCPACQIPPRRPRRAR